MTQVGTNVMDQSHPRRYPGGVLHTRFSLMDLNPGWEIDMTINTGQGSGKLKVTNEIISIRGLRQLPCSTMKKVSP